MPYNVRAERSPRKQNLALTLFKRAGRRLWIGLERGLSAVFLAWKRFGENHHLLYAAAISYYGIISLVPLLSLIHI